MLHALPPILLSLALAPAADAPAEDSEATPSQAAEQPWIRRWPPARNLVELGVFGGLIFPHPRLELFEPRVELEDQGFESLAALAPELGLRLAYFPLRVLGVEAEGAWMPSQTASEASVNLWAVRGHFILQIPRWSVTPFVLAGASGLAVTSDDSALGRDLDAGIHFGGGLKVFVSRRFIVRFDVRDTMTARRGLGTGIVHSPELLLGLGLALGRPRPQPAPVLDRDGDGILDTEDACPDTPGVTDYDGCPVPDTDGDGILDPEDACPKKPGVVDYDGCPIPDTDGDGIFDPQDACPKEPGVADYDGCPIPDTDGDGILDPEDACPKEPETVNSFEDEDGCPDVVPEKVKQFSGVIEGIYFDTAKATIKKKSFKKLDDAVAVLTEFPGIRIEVSGHTDDRGDEAYNQQLSEARAKAVRDYMVERGIAGERIETRGAGESQPRQSNTTKAGRAQNRRIEFKRLEK